MLKRKFASFAVTTLLLVSGGAIAAQPTFPSSVDETAPLSIPLMGGPQAASHPNVTAAVFPSGPSEASQFTFSTDAMDVAPERLGAIYGSVFPSSANETGARI